METLISMKTKVEPIATANRRTQLIRLVQSLPEARAVSTGNRQVSLEVGGNRFGWLLENQDGEGRPALNLKAPPGAGSRLAAYAPERFHVPGQFDHRDWVGIWLDSPAPDWMEIEELIGNAYFLVAPKRLIRNLKQPQ